MQNPSLLSRQIRRAARAARDFTLCCVAALSAATLIGQGFLPRCPEYPQEFFSSAYPPPPCHDASGTFCVGGAIFIFLAWYPLCCAAYEFNLRRYQK